VPDARRVRQGQHQSYSSTRSNVRAARRSILTEKASGAKADRPELAHVLRDVLRQGDAPPCLRSAVAAGLAERLRTALQIEMHLTLAFEHAFRLGEKRVSAEVVEQVLSGAIDELSRP
jgi:hypothetical protein